MKPKFTRRDFEEWLSKRRADETFCRSADLCPLAVFLSQRAGYTICVRSRFLETPEATYPAPKWVQKFLLAFDNRPEPSVRAARAVLKTC